MSEKYITDIVILKSRNIQNFNVNLSEKKRKHLILTGKNGSGKTSLLNDIAEFLNKSNSNGFISYKEEIKSIKEMEKYSVSEEYQGGGLFDRIRDTQQNLYSYGDVFLNFNKLPNVKNGNNFITTYFNSGRHVEFVKPDGTKLDNKKNEYGITDSANQNFIKYIFNMRVQKSFAHEDGDMDTVKKIDEWFLKFEELLQFLFDTPKLKLLFDRKNYNFEIILHDMLPFDFNTMADGYSSVFSIISELILRMEAFNEYNMIYDKQGIVLIDELETHLHVDLQKKIFPFLTGFFPKIQFIVSTHSPFILSSISNVVIYDLEKGFVTEDLSGYSYDAIIESYFDSDKYSSFIKQKITEFEELISKKELDTTEKYGLKKLRDYFSNVPKYLSKELMVKLQQIELNNLSKKDKS